MATVSEIVDYVKSNPNNPRAKQLSSQLQAGQFNDAASKEGVNLKEFGHDTLDTGSKGGLVGAIGKVGDFLGIEKFGRYAGANIANFVNKLEGIDVGDLHSKGMISDEEYNTITTGGVTSREALGSAATLGLELGTAGLGTAESIGGRVAQGATIGGSFGTAQAIGSAKNWKEALGDIALGGVVGAGTQLAFEGLKQVPKLIRWTSGTPELAAQSFLEEPNKNPFSLQSMGEISTAGKQANFVQETQGYVQRFRSSLTKEYEAEIPEIAKAFEGKTMTLPKSAQMAIGENLGLSLEDLSNKFENERLSVNLSNPQFSNDIEISAKDALNLNKEINKTLFSSRKLSQGPEGVVLRNIRQEFSSAMKNAFGGEQGAMASFLDNYGHMSDIHDQMNVLVDAYDRKNPFAISQSLKRLKQLYTSNDAAGVQTVKEFEDLTGSNVLKVIRDLGAKNFLPERMGGKTFLMRAAMAPLVFLSAGSPATAGFLTQLSPRIASIELQTIGTLANMADKYVPEYGQRFMKVALMQYLINKSKDRSK